MSHYKQFYSISRVVAVVSAFLLVSLGAYVACFVTAEEVIVQLGNDGYPYGRDMGSDGFKLAVMTEGNPEGVTYTWEKSFDQVTWERIDVTATPEIEIANPESGAWYRCVAGSTVSKAVRVVKPSEDPDNRKWTSSPSSWYLSNGTMAYTVYGSTFDVTGLYLKDGTEYMLQTSFSKSWNMYSDVSPEPEPKTYRAASEAQLENVYFSFSGSNDYLVYIDADLMDGQQAFSFGCDTMLGDNTTSGSYSDKAALIAQMNEDNSLKQIAMIGAKSETDAIDSDPAFVITPITGSGLRFWIGEYNARMVYGYETGSGSVYADGEMKTDVKTRVEDTDSGMTLSWLNVPSGGRVRFAFSVGDVANTGPVSPEPPVKEPHDDVILDPILIKLSHEETSRYAETDISAYVEATTNMIANALFDAAGNPLSISDGPLGVVDENAAGYLCFTAQESAVNGDYLIIVTVSGTQYEDYHIIQPVSVGRHTKNTEVVFDEANASGAFESVSAPRLQEYTEVQSDPGDIDVRLAVKTLEVNEMDADTKNSFDTAIHTSVFPDIRPEHIGYDYLDMTVTKTVNGQNPELIRDLGRVIEIAVRYQLTGKYEPIVLRRHGTMTNLFTALNERPAGGFTDGTFYLDPTPDEAGYVTIYVYTQYFSAYVIAYKTVITEPVETLPQPVTIPEPPAAQPAPPELKPAPVVTQPAPPELKPAPVVTQPSPVVVQPAPEAVIVTDVLTPVAWPSQVTEPEPAPTVERTRTAPRTDDDLPYMRYWCVMMLAGFALMLFSAYRMALEWVEGIAWYGRRDGLR